MQACFALVDMLGPKTSKFFLFHVDVLLTDAKYLTYLFTENKLFFFQSKTVSVLFFSSDAFSWH